MSTEEASVLDEQPSLVVLNEESSTSPRITICQWTRDELLSFRPHQKVSPPRVNLQNPSVALLFANPSSRSTSRSASGIEGENNASRNADANGRNFIRSPRVELTSIPSGQLKSNLLLDDTGFGSPPRETIGTTLDIAVPNARASDAAGWRRDAWDSNANHSVNGGTPDKASGWGDRNDNRRDKGKDRQDDWRKGKDAKPGKYDINNKFSRKLPMSDEWVDAGGADGSEEPVTTLDAFEQIRMQARQTWARPAADERTTHVEDCGQVDVLDEMFREEELQNGHHSANNALPGDSTTSSGLAVDLSSLFSGAPAAQDPIAVAPPPGMPIGPTTLPNTDPAPHNDRIVPSSDTNGPFTGTAAPGSRWGASTHDMLSSQAPGAQRLTLQQLVGDLSSQPKHNDINMLRKIWESDPVTSSPSVMSDRSTENPRMDPAPSSTFANWGAQPLQLPSEHHHAALPQQQQNTATDGLHNMSFPGANGAATAGVDPRAPANATNNKSAMDILQALLNRSNRAPAPVVSTAQEQQEHATNQNQLAALLHGAASQQWNNNASLPMGHRQQQDITREHALRHQQQQLMRRQKLIKQQQQQQAVINQHRAQQQYLQAQQQNGHLNTLSAAHQLSVQQQQQRAKQHIALTHAVQQQQQQQAAGQQTMKHIPAPRTSNAASQLTALQAMAMLQHQQQPHHHHQAMLNRNAAPHRPAVPGNPATDIRSLMFLNNQSQNNAGGGLAQQRPLNPHVQTHHPVQPDPRLHPVSAAMAQRYAMPAQLYGASHLQQQQQQYTYRRPVTSMAPQMQQQHVPNTIPHHLAQLGLNSPQGNARDQLVRLFAENLGSRPEL